MQLDLAPSDYPLHLQLESGLGDPSWAKVLSASLIVHLILLSVATRLPSLVIHTVPQRRTVEHRMPLYLPKDALTQKTPNKREVSKQVDIDSLLALAAQQAQKASPEPSRRQFEMPRNTSTKLARAPVTILPEPPALNTNQVAAPPLPGAVNGLSSAPPPAPTPSPGPFLNVGSEVPPNPHPTLAPPKTLQSSLTGLRQSGSGNNVVLSDDSPGPAAQLTPGTVGQIGTQHTGVELKTDTQGIDMRPYLAQILTIVRGNWRRVIPQGARGGGMRGKTVLEFIINRDGSIPKMVTAETSGNDPLDRAAIAGLSMSNPLPPLPSDFKGEQVRLAFSFSYNVATP